MKRVVVLGCAGAGKTTFTRRLSARIGAPANILDELWASPEIAADLEAFRAKVLAVHAQETWVSDGNFAVATFDLRLPRADLVIWLERPRWLCLWRAFTRVFRSGEDHGLAGLPDVLAYIWNFDRVSRPRIEAGLKQHGPGLKVLRTYGERDLPSDA